MTPAIEPDEILMDIVLPRPQQRRECAFQEFARASGEKFKSWGFPFGVNSDSVGQEVFHGKSCFD